MVGYIVLRYVKLSAEHRPTGKTKHYAGSVELPAPAALRIVKYATDPGYYLLYFDAQGDELTDTYHDDLAGAIDQAAWEFGVRPEDWQTEPPAKPAHVDGEEAKGEAKGTQLE